MPVLPRRSYRVQLGGAIAHTRADRGARHAGISIPYSLIHVRCRRVSVLRPRRGPAASHKAGPRTIVRSPAATFQSETTRATGLFHFQGPCSWWICRSDIFVSPSTRCPESCSVSCVPHVDLLTWVFFFFSAVDFRSAPTWRHGTLKVAAKLTTVAYQQAQLAQRHTATAAATSRRGFGKLSATLRLT